MVAAQPGDQIWVAQGTYWPDDASPDPNVPIFPRVAEFDLKPGVAMYGGFLGNESSIGQRPVWDVETESSPTILSGDLGENDLPADFPHGPTYQDNTYRVLHVPPGTSTSALTIIDGFTIEGGRANGAAGVGFNKGGGLRVDNGEVEIQRCTFVGNYATDGGGLWANRNGEIESCRFSSNLGGSAAGALNLTGAGEFFISNVIFDSNSAGNSGAVYCSGVPTLTLSLTMSFCRFSDNSASTGVAGAFRSDKSEVTVFNSTFSGNESLGGSGGAVFGDSAGSISLVNCLLVSNHAISDGGAFLARNAVIQNCTFSENIADLRGGGVHFAGETTSGLIINTILWGNYDRDGSPSNSLFSDESAQVDRVSAPATVTIQYSCLQNVFSYSGTGIIGGNPKLHDPVFTGNGDYHLQIASPCNDSGTNNTPIASSVDLDRNLRWADDPLITPDPGNPNPTQPPGCGGPLSPCVVIDMGCYEFNAIDAPFDIIYVNASVPPGGLRNGSSWANAMPNLRQAFTIAAGSSGFREIWVARGTYTPDGGYTPVGGNRVAGSGDEVATFPLVDGISVLGGFAGNEVLAEQRNPQAHETILSGDLGNDDVFTPGNPPTFTGYAGNSYHVVTASGVGSGTVLDGFTIRSGNTTGEPGDPDDRGGGFYNIGGSPAVSNCKFIENLAANAGGGALDSDEAATVYTDCLFQNNSALVGGGGVHINHGSSPTFERCVFSFNTAPYSSGGGGAVYCRTAYPILSAPLFVDCTFTSNWAAYKGGAVITEVDGRPTFVRCEFEQNESQVGGAVYSHSCSPVLNGCTLRNNSCISYGGGVYGAASSMKISNTKFFDNSAGEPGGAPDGFGGAVFTELPGASSYINCSFYRNSTDSQGGALFIFTASSATVMNCLFSGNLTPNNNGNAIYAQGNTETPAYVTVTNCTIVNGRDHSALNANTGGNILVRNTILWGNRHMGSGGLNVQYNFGGGGSISLDYCNVEGGPPPTGTGNFTANPMFVDDDGPDATYGTIDDDLRLLPGSPCIDAGRNSDVPLDAADLDEDLNATELTPFDLDLRDRFVDDLVAPDTGSGTPPLVDMGCYERFADCNANGIDDVLDISEATSLDCNTNGTPDECEIGLLNRENITTAAALNSGAFTDVNGSNDDVNCTISTNQRGVWLAAWRTWGNTYSNLRNDFNRFYNPAGAWTYGYYPPWTGAPVNPSSFVPFNTAAPLFGAFTAGWQWYSSGIGTEPTVGRNEGGMAHGVPPGWALLHPGPANQAAVARWTAPISGVADIFGQTLSGDFALERLHILHQGVSLYSSTLTSSGVSFSLTPTVAAGDVIDFVVEGEYGGGTTPLEATIAMGGATAPEYDILYSRSVDAGATWSDSLPLTENSATDSSNDFWVAMENDGGSTWIAAWTEQAAAGPDYDIVFRRSTNDGLTWTPTAKLNAYFNDPENGYDDIPEMATDRNGNWVLVFISKTPALTNGDTGIIVSRSSDNGASWTTPQLLHATMFADGRDHSRPRIATDETGVWVATWTSRPLSPVNQAEFDILYSVSQNNGATWSPPALLNDFFAPVFAENQADDASPYVVTDRAGNWVVVWTTSENFNGIQPPSQGDQDILAARITTADLLASQEWDISIVNSHAASDFAQNDSFPHIATDGMGNWFAVWESHFPPGNPAGDDRDVFVAHSQDAGATWSAPVVVNSYAETAGEPDNWPKLATDQAGLWIVTWHGNDAIIGASTGGESDIGYARFRTTSDCNNNGKLDECELPDINGNLLLDVCEDDCNSNGIIDLFEPDGDGDTRIDDCDNCLSVPNVGQHDADSDGVGDACDICPVGDDAVDGDGDLIPDACDKCPGLLLPAHVAPTDCNGDGDTTDFGEEVGGQCDSDLDGVGDSVGVGDDDDGCDNCPEFYNPAQLPDEPCQNAYGLGSRLDPPLALVGVSLVHSVAQITTNQEWMNPGFNPLDISEGQWVAADLAVIQHPSNSAFYAIDAGLIRMTWKNAAGAILWQSFFVVQNQAAVNDWTAGVRYFLDYNEGQFDKNADVNITTSLYATVMYNSQILEYRINPQTNPPQYYPFPDFRIDGDRAIAEDYCPSGKVCVLYEDGPGGAFVGFEVVDIYRFGPGELQTVPVGRRLILPDGATDCRAVLISNFEELGTRAAWQKGVEDAAVYPLRPESLPSNFVVAWYKESVFPNAIIQSTGNCWPLTVYRYRADWPIDPQVHVVDGNDQTVPLGSQVNLQVGAGERYCQAEVMYQQSFDPSEDPPFSQIVNGVFDAINPGFSVIRFDLDPPGAGLCGDDVTFEVVMSRDRLDATQKCGSGSIAGEACTVDANCFAVFNPATGVCRPRVHAGVLPCVIGQQLSDNEHNSQTPNFPYGFLYAGQPYAPEIYADTGQIFPVNHYDPHGTLEVWWFVESRTTTGGNFAEGVYWPHKTALYQPDWPANPYKIVIARRVGGESTQDVPVEYDTFAQVYSKGNKATILTDLGTMPGWNPNDEHAVILPIGDHYRVFATRDDYPWSAGAALSGHPYVLVQYHPTIENVLRLDLWNMDVFRVLAEDVDDPPPGNPNDLDYTDLISQASPPNTVAIVAGMPLSPVLFPINYGAPDCFDTTVNPPVPRNKSIGDAVWLDRKGGAWVVEAHHDNNNPPLNPQGDPEGPGTAGSPSVSDVYLWENWGPNDGCTPWLSYKTPVPAGEPEPIRFRPQWPPVPPACAFPNDALCARPLQIGDTVDQSGQCGRIQKLHDSVGLRIIDPTHWVDNRDDFVLDEELIGNIALEKFEKLPPHLYSGEIGGGGEFPDRIRWNFNGSQKLEFRGIMSDADKYYLLQISEPGNYEDAIADLYIESRKQLETPIQDAANKFVTVGDAGAVPGWITVAFQNDEDCVEAGLPVSVEVWRVDCPPATGFIRVVQPKCLFSEKLTLQFSGDLGGKADLVTFHWQYSLDYHPAHPQLASWRDYSPSELPVPILDGTGLREVVIEGASPFTLQDTWWRVRYRGYLGCPYSPSPGEVPWPDGEFPGGQDTQMSEFTEPQLAEGWVKRVVRQLNPFDQRFDSFHQSPVNTIVDMIAQAGVRFQDDVALNCDPSNLNAIGLIEAYSTVMNRAREFSVGYDIPRVNQAIELAASKVSDLYMLLGNEAYADAMDPTLGVFAGGGEAPAGYNPLAAFSFQDQLPSLLEEELALLRGVPDTRPPDFNADGQLIATVYNRLPWNFTSGVGQVAYANNYQMTDVAQALQTYPQGHGDAWGHYLQATKLFYQLLNNSGMTWITASESVIVAGQPVEVGFMYERKFAEAAAAKARTGAAITALTFRQQYTGNPEDQNGYPDNDPERSWGLAEWGRRAGQGAYFDWVMANAILDDQSDGMICQITGTPCGEDTIGCGRIDEFDPQSPFDTCVPDEGHENSIRKVDRTTVKDLGEIASAYSEIQATLDKADAGLNPLGLAANVVPFGLNPTAIVEGQTHFDQVHARAVSALSNAVTAFNYANENTRRLRTLQDRVDTFDDLVEERELDYEARLIEIFGRPYAEDIGATGAYPAGYVGPDFYHYDYADPSELVGSQGSGNTTTFTVTFQEQTVDPNSGAITTSPRVVNYVVSTDGLGLVKPADWTERAEPGEIQFARSELLQGLGRYQQALDRYEALLDQIETQADLLESLYDLNRNVLQVMREGQAYQQSLNQQILVGRILQAQLRSRGQLIQKIANAIAEGLPTSLIGGWSFGGDFTGPIRAILRFAAARISSIMDSAADALGYVEQQRQFDKEWASAEQQIRITGFQGDYQVEQQIATLLNLVRQLPSSRLEIYTLGESVNQAAGRYHSAIGKGLRLWEQRTAFRRRTADELSEHRYQDMAFRVFRNESLQKYRAQFDLAAEYVYLAARAYDYETNLLNTHELAGRQYLTNIVKQRTLGVLDSSGPLVGSGLAGTLAEMFINFDLVLRPQLGFNSPAEMNRTFSLRWEKFRHPNTNAYNSAWQASLAGCYEPDLNTVAEYRMYCKPLQPTISPNPALVIPFSTKVHSGLNLFGHASQADEVYPSSYDSIKLHSVGVRFDNYPVGTLNNQAEVYLVPIGMDVMREPTNGEIREWQLLDQTLPVPFPLSEQSLAAADWMPWDGLSGGSRAMVKRRLHPQITGLPTQGHEDDEDLRFHLTGRSVWNTEWVLIIPASELLGGTNPKGDGIDIFISGPTGQAPGVGVKDIKLIFNSYGYSGTANIAETQPAGDDENAEHEQAESSAE